MCKSGVKNRTVISVAFVLLAAALTLFVASCGKTDKSASPVKSETAADVADIAMAAIVSGDRATMEGIMSAKYGDSEKIKERSASMVMDADMLNKYEITYKIGKTESVSDLECIKSTVAKGGVLSEKDVTAAVKVQIDLEMTEKGGESVPKTRYIIMTKEGGVWKLFDLAK